MESLNAVVLEVIGNRTNNGKVKYDVKLSDGNTYTTFKGPLATKAQQLLNQQATAYIELKPKRDGDGFWRNLEEIGPVGSLAPLAGAAVQVPIPVAGDAPAAGIPINEAPSGN